MHAMFSFSRFIHVGLTSLFFFHCSKNKLTDLNTKQQKKRKTSQQNRFQVFLKLFQLEKCIFHNFPQWKIEIEKIFW